jgi:hypothetical protein
MRIDERTIIYESANGAMPPAEAKRVRHQRDDAIEPALDPAVAAEWGAAAPQL